MGIFKKKEQRADAVTEFEDGLLQSLLNPSTMTKTKVQNIPSVQSCINFIADNVAMLPIKLYTEKDGKSEEVKSDKRTALLNDDTGDTLDAVQFWRAMLTDYYLGKGGYAYIKKQKNSFASLHYTDETNITIMKNTDPIFKSYEIMINGAKYKPYDFIKLLRNTKDGASGSGMISENSLILSVAYNSLVYEENLVKKGGNKKGFLKAQKKLTQEVIDKLKVAWANLYSNNSENIVVLNDGLDFQEASNTSVEMQLNENKKTNSSEICKLFNVAASIISGTASAKEYSNSFKMAVLPVLKTIECALNRDLLLEKEKGSFYFAFDTKEMLKGDIKERFEAYKTGIDANFLQIDEVRFMEDLPALGLDWIKLSLDSVLYDTKTKQIYTPNTNKTQSMEGGEADESGDQS